MRVKRTSCLVALILVTMVVGSTVKNVRAQFETVNFVLRVSDNISLYSVSSNGILQAVGELPANIGLLDSGTQKEWTIPTREDIVISPDRQHIAFVAFNKDQVSLFVYNIRRSNLVQNTIPGLGNL
jgi:hypothetical protein